MSIFYISASNQSNNKKKYVFVPVNVTYMCVNNETRLNIKCAEITSIYQTTAKANAAKLQAQTHLDFWYDMKRAKTHRRLFFFSYGVNTKAF